MSDALSDAFVLLTDLLTPDRVVLPVTAPDKRGVLRELTRALVERSGGEFDDVLEAVEEREDVLSTGIGFGVAIPHGKSRSVKELTVVGGVSVAPVAYEAIDGEPVRIFFLIVGPESSAGQHVKVLSRIARLVRQEPLRARLLEARTPQEFYNALLEAEVR